MKVCSMCKNLFDESFFYADKRRPDGLKSQCKKCHTITSMKTRDPEKHRDYNRKWMRESKYCTRQEVRDRHLMASRVHNKTKAAKARALANRAVQLGFLERPERCSECLVIGVIHAHHEDYSKPLDVIWLCSQCHGKKHRKLIEGKGGGE